MITTMAGSTARRKHNVMQLLHLKNNYTSKCTSTSICTSTISIIMYNHVKYYTSTIYIYNLHVHLQFTEYTDHTH